MSRRRRSGGGGEHDGGSERWLLTYADMITLLLALFIVLYAMSTINVVQFEAVRRSLSRSFQGQVFLNDKNVVDGSQSVLDPSSTSADPSHSPSQLRKDATAKLNSAFAAQERKIKQLAQSTSPNSGKDVKVITTERGIVIRLDGDSFFQSGSAQLNPKFQGFLDKLAVQLREHGRPLAIEGHTDAAPIASAQFPSNWELSTSRALTVLHFLDSRKVGLMHATGYGDTRPIVQPPKGDTHRSIARNRRVEIVVIAPGGDQRTPLGGSGASTSAPIPAAVGINPVAEPVDPSTIIGPIIDISTGL